jgi:molybdopterin converting factor small subunit
LEELVREQARGQLEGISLRTAVNRVYVPESVVVQDGDEIAFIPPVQGG